MLLSVNVGLPRDVPWQGKTVHTGIWKSPVAGPVLARRGNLDGDGQGDLNGHGGEQRAVLVYQIQSYRHWQQHFGPPTMTTASASSARTSPSTACPTTRCASGTGTASARPSSRSPSRGSPATGSACASASPNCPRCWSATTAPGSTCGSSGKGTSRPGDQIIKTADRPARAHRGRHRRAALPPAPGPGQAAGRGADPGAQPRLAAVLPRPAGRRRGAGPGSAPPARRRAGAGPAARLGRIPCAAGGPGGPGEHDGVLDLPGRHRRRRAPARAGRPVPDAAGQRGRPARPGAQLLAVQPHRMAAATGSASSTSHTAPPAAT